MDALAGDVDAELGKKRVGVHRRPAIDLLRGRTPLRLHVDGLLP